jgi:hypothetical protein
MKMNLLKTLSLLLLMTLVIAGCQKNATEKIIPPVSAMEKEGSLNAKQSGCKLVYSNLKGILWQNYTYNQNGMIDRWRLVYTKAAISTTMKLSYHQNGELSRADAIISPSGLREYAHFTYQGNNITKVEWRFTETNELDVEIFVTYNGNNQVTKFDLPIYNYYILYTYNGDGNVIRADFYVDGFLSFFYEYTYTDYIRNPELLLVSSGLPFDFFSPWIQNYPQHPNGTSAYEWNETTSSYELYGQMLPENTTFTVNSSGNPESIIRFEEFSNEPVERFYNYANCGSGNQKQTNLTGEGDPTGTGVVLNKAERMKILKEIMMARMPKTGKGN